jgi:SNF2 family DNA or RNA helicase
MQDTFSITYVDKDGVYIEGELHDYFLLNISNTFRDVLDNDDMRWCTDLETASIKPYQVYARNPSGFAKTSTDLLRKAKACKILHNQLVEKYGFRGLPLRKEFYLYDYQKRVLAWAIKRETINFRGMKGGIIALFMGAGKTLMGLSLALMSIPKPFKDTKTIFPTLVICSKTILYEWKSNATQFFGDNINVLYMHKDLTHDAILKSLTRKKILTYDIVITTYDVVRSTCRKGDFHKFTEVMGYGLWIGKVMEVKCRDWIKADLPQLTGYNVLYGTPWRRIIADESQKFANYKTATYKAIMALYGDYKWCLSGTPIRNYDTDIWAQFRFLGYTDVNVPKDWSEGRYRRDNLRQAVAVLTHELVGMKMPLKIRVPLNIEHTGNEKEMHKIILRIAQETYDDFIKGLIGYDNVLAIFARLRQVCIAPYIMTADAKRNNKQKNAEIRILQQIGSKLRDSDLGKWVLDKNGTAGIRSAKIQAVVKIVKDIYTYKSPNDPALIKILIFSSFVSCLDLLEYAFKQFIPHIPTYMIDGSVKGDLRFATIDMFKANVSPVCVLFAGIKVGGEGLNLQQATHVIVVEPWWNRAITDQAEARAWRFGQLNTVYVHDIIIQNSIELPIIRLCEEKSRMAQNYLMGTTNARQSVGLDSASMGRLLFAK